MNEMVFFPNTMGAGCGLRETLRVNPLGFESRFEHRGDKREPLLPRIGRIGPIKHAPGGIQAPGFHPRMPGDGNRKTRGISITDGVKPERLSLLTYFLFTHTKDPGICITDVSNKSIAFRTKRALGFQSQMAVIAPAFQSPMTWELHHETRGIPITDKTKPTGIPPTLFGPGP